MTCNNDCCAIVDDLLEQIQNGLGKVDYDKIDEYIDERIEELRESIIAGEITADVDLDALVEKIKESIAAGNIPIEAYEVAYKHITVGDALDELNKSIIPFEGSISELREYTIGEVAYNVPVRFSFNKALKSLTVRLYINDMESSTFGIDKDARVFELPKLNATTQVVVEAISTEDEKLVLSTTAYFRLKYYVGCCGSRRISNNEVLSLNSYYAKPEVTEYSHIFHPMGSQYLWWVFPVDLHTDYDFFNNGLMDSNYVWTTGNVTNEYGYTSTYLFIRSGNPHTSSNIYTEVKSHEHK